MEKKLLKKLKNRLLKKNQEEVKTETKNDPQLNRNSIKVLKGQPESYFTDEGATTETKLPEKIKTTIKKLPKKTEHPQKNNYNKNSIPVLNSREDMLEAFSKASAPKHGRAKVKKEPRKIKADPYKKPPVSFRDKNGIKILDNSKDLNSMFDNSNQWTKTTSTFTTQQSLLKAKKGGETKKTKLPLEKRLKRYPKPEKSLDLHGFTSIQAKLKAENFIKTSWENGFFTLKIITGKGTHSQGGAVLPDLMEDLANDLKTERIILAHKWENQVKEKSGSIIIYLNRFD